MINREWVDVSVITFTSGTNAYGQKRQLGQTARTVKMVVHDFEIGNVDDVRYADVVKIGLTRDLNITDENEVVYDGKQYTINFTKKTGKYLQVFMRRK